MFSQQEVDTFFKDLEALQLRFPVAELHRMTGYSKGNISGWLRNKNPSENFVNKFYESTKRLKKGSTGKNESSEISSKTKGNAYTKGRFKQKMESALSEVPVYGGFSSLGNLQVYDDSREKNEVIATLPGNIFPGCDHAEKAKGDSMYPLIMNQAWLVGKKCPVNGITIGEKYIIKTKDGLDTTKFVHPGSKRGTIKLKAYNKSIPDQDVLMDEIVFACRVLWIVNPT